MPTSVRPIVIDGPIAYLPLTKGFTATLDAADVWLVERWSWFALQSASGRVYAGRSARLNGRKYTVLLHRHLIGAPQAYDVDHQDGDGLNCRRGNLRLCTPAQNNRNVGLSPRNKLGIKGVFHNGSSFVATIKVDGKSRYLGSFDSAAGAKTAYDAAAREASGEFSRPA